MHMTNIKSARKTAGEKGTKLERTSPDTRPIPVAGGWAEVVMLVLALSNLSVMDQQTDKPLRELLGCN